MADIAVTYLATLSVFSRIGGRLAFRTVADDAHAANPSKSISGHVRQTDGTAVAGATVLLFRQVDSVLVAQMTTDPNGLYSFVRGETDTNAYYTVGFSLVNGAVQIHGTSNRGLVAI